MRKTYEFRIKPTPIQERRFIATLNACRFVYNWGIEDRKNLWEYCHTSTNFNDQAGCLKHLKNANPWLKEVHAHPLQNAIMRVKTSFDRFFKFHKKGHGYPRFKGKNQYVSLTFPEWLNGASFDGKRLFLSKIGRVRINLHRPIEGEIKTCTIKRRADGWYALFSVILADLKPSKIFNPVGIDVGLTTFAKLSDGSGIENPRHYRHAERELKIAQRKVSRRKKGSVRRKKAVQHLKLIHQRVERARRCFHFEKAHELVSQFNPIFGEKLNIKNMVRNHCLAKSITDAAWGQFLGILSHSAESAGGSYMEVEARGTSQECICGAYVPKDLSTRIHRCPKCGLVADRDWVSSVVIKIRGLKKWLPLHPEVMEQLRLGRSIGESSGCKLDSMTREAAGL